MTTAIESPATLERAGSDVTEIMVHEFLGGLCCCGSCAAQSAAGLPASAGAQAGAVAAALPSTADILTAMQYELTSLSNDVLNTSGDPAYNFTYQFAGDAQPDDWATDAQGNFVWGEWEGWRAFSQAEKDAVRAAMDQIEAAVNVTFTEVTGDPDPDLNVGLVTIPGLTAGFGGFSYSASSIDGGVTWTLGEYDAFVLYDESLDLTTSVNLLLHELGHALTLKHPFDAPALPSGVETNKYTVMSYTQNPDTGVDADTLQLFDMLALHDRWGANLDTGDRGDRYTGPGTAQTLTIWDGGSRSDWLDALGLNNDVVLNLNEGEYSQFTGRDDVVIAFGVEIEHARGGNGDDLLTGNARGNKLLGGKGADTLHGNDGADYMVGGKGSDILYGGDRDDEMRGGQGGDQLFGGRQKDTLFGGGGRDHLDGEQGADTLEGGTGADTFYFREGGGADVISDFQNDRDRVLFEIDGAGSKFLLRQYAAQDGNDVVYDFGGGDVLRILNITVADMADDIGVA